jgi:hypothetical protein
VYIELSTDETAAAVCQLRAFYFAVSRAEVDLSPCLITTKTYEGVEVCIGTLSCKPSNLRKRVRKVIKKAKLKGDQRSEVKRSKLWLNEGKDLRQYLFHDCYCSVM